MQIRRLSISDNEQLETLLKDIESELKHKEFWLPINDISKEHFFDEEWTIWVGAFSDNKLVGAVALFKNEHEFKESVQQLDIHKEKVIELGRLMVHPDYRGQKLSKLLIESICKECTFCDIIIATVHPDNVASKIALLNCGFTYMKTYIKSCGYIRDIVVKKLPM